MRGKLIGGSAAILAFLMSGAAPAAACDRWCGGPVYTYGPPPIYVVPPRVYIAPPLFAPFFYGEFYDRPYRRRYYHRHWRGSYGAERGYYRSIQSGSEGIHRRPSLHDAACPSRWCLFHSP